MKLITTTEEEFNLVKNIITRTRNIINLKLFLSFLNTHNGELQGLNFNDNDSDLFGIHSSEPHYLVKYHDSLRRLQNLSSKSGPASISSYFSQISNEYERTMNNFFSLYSPKGGYFN